ncbi:MAG: alpha/beta hydrolase [Dehalococcoidia bacterium]|nr:alpha/beta hydrolase [Dehalococcoidia bacterium]
MPFADAAGVKIYYEALGAGDPIIMLQGFGQYSLQWGGLPDELVKLQYQVILIDNRGTGRSDKPDAPITVAGMADDVCTVMDALSLRQASLFGVSMGGMIAQEFAINHTDRLNNLMLGCTTPGGSNSVAPTPVGARVLFDFDYMKNMTPEQRSREVFNLFCSEDFIQENPDALKNYHEATIKYPTPLFTFARQADAVFKFDTWDRLAEIKSPTMIICGTSDHIVPFKNSELLKQMIANSELILLQDKRHGFYIEAMDSTRIFINGFMKRHGKR